MSIIYDMHAHIFPQKISEKAVNSIGAFYDIPMTGGKGHADDLAQREKNAGVTKALVCSTATTAMQVTAINSFISGEISRHPEFIGFGTLHPDFEDIPGEVKRIKELGLKGIKLHPDFQNFNIDAKNALIIYECARDEKLPVLVHMGDNRYDYSKPFRLMNVLKQFPGLTVIGAHLGGYASWKEALEIPGYLGHDGLFIDTSSSLPFLSEDKVLEIMEKQGYEKIFWGTDYPMWEPQEELQRFMKLKLKDDIKEKILALNAIELMGE